jgi:hypothetical protein
MITESDALARALDEAARIWPECADERAELLRRLIDRGIQAVDAEFAEFVAERQKKVMELAGSMSGLWSENWREEFRSEWPA